MWLTNTIPLYKSFGLPGSGRPLRREVKEIVEGAIRADDETTTVQLHKILAQEGHPIPPSVLSLDVEQG